MVKVRHIEHKTQDVFYVVCVRCKLLYRFSTDTHKIVDLPFKWYIKTYLQVEEKCFVMVEKQQTAVMSLPGRLIRRRTTIFFIIILFSKSNPLVVNTHDFKMTIRVLSFFLVFFLSSFSFVFVFSPPISLVFPSEMVRFTFYFFKRFYTSNIVLY